MDLFPWIVMLCAAFAAGAINSIAGGGTLLTFPVLIWLGLDPKVANATSTVALWPGLFGGLYGYRKELENSSAILIRLGVTSVIGGGIGAWLLIWTPSPTFARLVPFLILFATILFMLQGTINRRLRLGSLETNQTKLWWTGAIVFQFFSAMYGGRKRNTVSWVRLIKMPLAKSSPTTAFAVSAESRSIGSYGCRGDHRRGTRSRRCLSRTRALRQSRRGRD